MVYYISPLPPLLFLIFCGKMRCICLRTENHREVELKDTYIKSHQSREKDRRIMSLSPVWVTNQGLPFKKQLRIGLVLLRPYI